MTATFLTAYHRNGVIRWSRDGFDYDTFRVVFSNLDLRHIGLSVDGKLPLRGLTASVTSLKAV